MGVSPGVKVKRPSVQSKQPSSASRNLSDRALRIASSGTFPESTRIFPSATLVASCCWKASVYSSSVIIPMFIRNWARYSRGALLPAWMTAPSLMTTWWRSSGRSTSNVPVAFRLPEVGHQIPERHRRKVAQEATHER